MARDGIEPSHADLMPLNIGMACLVLGAALALPVQANARWASDGPAQDHEFGQNAGASNAR